MFSPPDSSGSDHMPVDIVSLLRSQHQQSRIEGPLVIYGAGNTGRAVLAYLAKMNIAVAAFVDTKASEGALVEGIPAFPLAAWLSRFDPAEHTVLVAIHNRDADMLPLLNTLNSQPFRRVLTMVDFVNIYPEDQPFRFWLAPAAYYQDHIADIQALMALLADEASSAHVERILRFRITGDYTALPTPTPEDQYVPSDLPRWREPLRLVDCGAYDGDTLALFHQAGYRLEAVATFEPDLANYAKLVAGHSGMGLINFPCGVSDKTAMLSFDAGQGEASRISSQGKCMIQCVSLDDAIPEFRPSLIKMDVEGAEINALKGSEKVIRRDRPDLALSLYHTPGHLWEIPLLIHGWNLGYRFHVRCHAQNSFDSVLYAVQPGN
jgi:FkbM family methyltransferase